MSRTGPLPFHGKVCACLSLIVVGLVTDHAGLHAQPTTGPHASSAVTTAAPLGTGRAQSPEGEARRWWNGWSLTSPEDRAIWGMWTIHLYKVHEGVSYDPTTVALIYRGFYAATFRTTHGPRGYTLGVERSWLSGSSGAFGGMLGFRGGLVYGYDHRLGWMAKKYPILPFVQPVVYGRIGPLTADLTYTWVVMSLTAGLRF